MMSKLNSRLSRLHQSRVRAVEESHDRTTGVFHADLAPETIPTLPTPQTRTVHDAWRAVGTSQDLVFQHLFANGHGRFSPDELRTDLPHTWTPQTTLVEATPAHKVAYLDIETNGLDTRAFAFCIGLGFWAHDTFVVDQFVVAGPNDETDVLTRLAQRLNDFDALVTFNGRSFDVPRLQARFDLNAIAAPFARLNHIDLLIIARRLLPGGALNLTALERTFIDFHRIDDIPGSEAPRRWQTYERTGLVSGLLPLFEHNALDIVSLAALQAAFKQLLTNTPQPRPKRPAPTPAPTPAPAYPPNERPLTDLQAQLAKTYRLKTGRTVRPSNNAPQHPKSPPSPLPQTPANHGAHIGQRIATLRQQVTPLLANHDFEHALPILFEMVALAPTNAYPLAELARYYVSAGEVDLARTFELRLKALGMHL